MNSAKIDCSRNKKARRRNAPNHQLSSDDAHADNDDWHWHIATANSQVLMQRFAMEGGGIGL